jgi:hypothetical protein
MKALGLGGPWVGVYTEGSPSTYPQRRMNILEDRINDCFERS